MKLYYLLPVLLALSCSSNQIETKSEDAPVAKIEEHIITEHGESRTDNYFWMRLSDNQKNAENPDQQTQDVLNYLHAENDYLQTKMAHTDSLQSILYNEMVSRIKQDDESLPVSENGYTYYDRFEEGEDYPLYCRKKENKNAEVEVLLNGPEMGNSLSYFGVGGYSISLDNQLMVYGIDTVSRRQYTLYIKNLVTGETYDDCITNTNGFAVWANDNKTIFYAKADPQTLRDCYIYKHVIGTPQSEDELVFEEKDETFSCDVYKSKSNRFIMIMSYQTMSTEVRFIDANQPQSSWKIVQPRERGLEYSVYDAGKDFYIVTNHQAKNFRLMKTTIDKCGKENWKEVIAHRNDVMIEGIELFEKFMVVNERENGLNKYRVIDLKDCTEHYVEFNDPAYYTYYHDNLNYTTTKLRYTYTSLNTPFTTYEYDLVTKEKKVLKAEEVIDSKFSPENYQSERLHATATDGTKIPISLVYKKGIKLDGTNPLLLYAYGSYGANTEPYFSSARLSLLDRGFIYAMAHVRGGQELGRQWYEDGKLLKKKNTFTDFINCAEFLIEQKYTSKEHLYAEGASAGGLLMGTIINMRPDLWRGVIAGVPFVDVISTMWDETIPLTTSEFDEWGNPKDKVYYDYMKSYSPYNNVEAKDYPNLLVTTGYWDSQVQYWEPAKWVAKLRALKTDENLLLLSCNMDVGHGGASGRYKRYKEIALEYAFLLSLEGIEK